MIRFEGEVVAAVAARTAEIAAAAIELIDLDLEELPPVTDPEAALQPDSALVHADWASYTAYDGLIRSRNDCAYVTIVKGDVGAGFAKADEVIEERYVCDQSHPVPIEPHAVVAQWQGDKVTVWSTSQVPFSARAGVAETLQMPESNVRIVVPHLGGGCGGKCGACRVQPARRIRRSRQGQSSDRHRLEDWGHTRRRDDRAVGANRPRHRRLCV